MLVNKRAGKRKESEETEREREREIERERLIGAGCKRDKLRERRETGR